ncbi:pentapeptide repeat-containing protein [Streptomyces collinus]
MSPMSTPPWPHCGHGADSSDPIGCRGIHVTDHAQCLAHLTDADRATYLASLIPGAYIDHRGTDLDALLLDKLLVALIDPSTGYPRFGTTRFEDAQFSGDARFDGAHFSGDARFNRAHFSGDARFPGAQFSGDALFHGAQFSGHAAFGEGQFSGSAVFFKAQFSDLAWFHGARFSGRTGFGEAQFCSDAMFGQARFSDGVGFLEAKFFDDAEFGEAHFSGDASFGRVQFSGRAGFEQTQFSGDALFGKATFSKAAWFGEAQFSRLAKFDEAQFSGDALFREARFPAAAEFQKAQFSGRAEFSGVQAQAASFREARFDGAPALGPLVCTHAVDLAEAVFSLPTTVEIAARQVVCERTRWESTATVRLRYAAVDLQHAVFSAPVAITAYPRPFMPLLGGELNGSDTVRVVSVQGVDAAHLVMTDTDLSDCLFSGAFHLDQIRLEGNITFAPTPTGWHRYGIWPVRWTRRRAVAEEHHWRAQTEAQPVTIPLTTSPDRWRLAPQYYDRALTPDPVDIAALYRQLRKAFEDGKNEPGAADFYYGECEMRRHDTTGTPKGERRLLWAYWLLSGYGLRASRAFGWLLAAMSLTILLLMSFGLPAHDPDPSTAGTLHGSKISLHTSTPDPALHGPWAQHMTWARAEKATRVAVNSVVFRSSGQNLTTFGTYIEMGSRLFEPTLLALAALAVRGRIKR